MATDENLFFRRATMQICGSLNIGIASQRCLNYLRTVMPGDVLTLYLLEEGLGLRTVATATPEEGKEADLLLPLSAALLERMHRMDIPHTMVERPGFEPVMVRIVNRSEEDPVVRALAGYFERTDYSAIVMYLTIEGTRQGTLFLKAFGKDRYTAADASLLALLAEPFAVALSNSIQHRKVLRLTDMLAEDNKYLHRELLRISGDQIIGAEYGLKGVMEMVRQVAGLNSVVLLRGETGSGKDVIANAIHYSSPRREGPFIKVNCGAIPETLLDSELFGHEKGAFTGAFTQKRGCFERANGGTIFLDEIGELPPPAQIRLLRVLQYKEVVRVGGSTPIPVNIRVIAATHRALEEMVQDGRFREDLWFRLNVFPIFIPSLRERKADIPALVHHFITRKAKELKLPRVPVVAPGSIDRLVDYHWPGNVRELENIVERALILSKDGLLRFGPALLTAEEPGPHVTKENDETRALDDVMCRHIKETLILTKGRIHGPEGAAKLLGVNPSTLRNRMNRLGIAYGRRRQG